MAKDQGRGAGGVVRVDPLSGRTLSETLVGVLRERILEGEFASGTRLSDVDLADAFSVSRATARDALRQLCHEGLVVTYPHRGFFVSEVTPADIIDLLELRALLEGRAAAAAVLRLTDEDFTRLDELAEAIERRDYQKDISEIRELDIVFHGLIARRSEKPILIELWSALNSRLFLMESVCRDILQLTGEGSARRHRDYIATLRQRSPEQARVAAEGHYLYYLDLLMRAFEEGSGAALTEPWRDALRRRAAEIAGEREEAGHDHT